MGRHIVSAQKFLEREIPRTEMAGDRASSFVFHRLNWRTRGSPYSRVGRAWWINESQERIVVEMFAGGGRGGSSTIQPHQKIHGVRSWIRQIGRQSGLLQLRGVSSQNYNYYQTSFLIIPLTQMMVQPCQTLVLGMIKRMILLGFSSFSS